MDAPVGTEPRASRGDLDPIAEVEMMGSIAVATVTVTELTQETGAEQLADLLATMAETGADHYVLDVQNVKYMDTTCLGCLVQALNDLATRGGRIALANPHRSVRYVFQLTRLDRVFRICGDVMAAIDAVEDLREAG
jgi:anti-sigma B factor antagonist